MAKTKEEKMTKSVNEVVTEEKKAETQKVATKSETKSGPTYDELLSLVQSLASEVNQLKSNIKQDRPSEDNKTDELIALLTNRKSDKEVTIVHNLETNGGLTTHLALSSVVIDFRSVGEERVLSWPQFEECVSKYRSFFDRRFILVSDKNADIAERYNLPVINHGDKHTLTHADIVKLPKLSVPKLEEFMNTLDEESQDAVFSYWLGKCYTKEPGFYDRYKIETLNRISGDHAFDTLLLVMNGETLNTDTK